MGQASFFDNVREWVGGIAFAIYLWSAKMSEEEFLAEHERQAVQHLRALDEAKVCRVINHFFVDGVCSQCGSKQPPHQ